MEMVLTDDYLSGRPGGFFNVEHDHGMVSMPDEHYHDNYEIYFYLGRQMTQFIQDRSFTLRRGDLALINRHVYHRTRYSPEEKESERVLITFSREMLRLLDLPRLDSRIEKLFALRKPCFQSERDRKTVEEAVLRLNGAFAGAGHDSALLLCRLQLCELLCLLIDMMERGAISADHEDLNNAEKRIAAVARYINENFAGNISLEELSQLFFTGRFTLCHDFKRVTGSTVLEFLTRKRLNEACRLLRETDRSITDIAHATGFRSINCFNEKFRRALDRTPRQYRQLHCGGKG